MRLLLLFVFAAICVAAAALGLLMWEDASPERIIEAQVSGVRFFYRQAYARDEATTAGGLSDRLSFVASLPNFAPPDAHDRIGPSVVAVTVTPKDDSPDPSLRPTTLYARFLSDETAAGPGGLILRHFEANSPYDLEQLYVSPDARSFFARCPKPGGAAGDTCLSMFRDGPLDIELRYAPALLEHWSALSDGARAMLAKMTAPRKKVRAPIK